MPKAVITLLIFVATTVLGLGQRTSSLGAGTDTFDVIVQIKAEFALPGSETDALLRAELEVDTVGPITVVRSEPRRGPGGTATVETEIVSMSLTGFHPTLGEIKVHQSPDKPSSGAIRMRGPGPSERFQVDSFFDIFFDITLEGHPGIRVLNMEPASGRARVSSWPPLEMPYVHQVLQEERVKLYAMDESGTQLEVGAILEARVIPTQASHARLKRELIQIERLLFRLLRLHQITDLADH